MTNTYKHALIELELLLEYASKDDRPLVEPIIPEILQICEKIAQGGHSETSAHYAAHIVAHTIHQLLLQQPIQPLMGTDNEWMDVSAANDDKPGTLFQNTRKFDVFKEGTCGVPYFLDAIIWRYPDGEGVHGSALAPDGNVYLSRQYFRMPLLPKTFYIDVVEADSDSPFSCKVKSMDQLREVFDYYIHPNDL